ncbi:hypothetical protein [Paenibacillus sp. SN-8-1]|uniref:hypothetical protein n=1 Tax=Paenibacillus sp. SN-8-1 TaxID=3435409 RepID=UPI003D9A53D8
MRKLMLFMISSLLLSVLMIAGCTKTQPINDPAKDGLVTDSINFGIGGDLNKTVVSYNFILWNKTKNTVVVRSVEPILSADLSNRIQNTGLLNQINKSLNGGSTMAISGSFSFDTHGLDKQGVEKLNIDLRKFRVITEQEVGMLP